MAQRVGSKERVIKERVSGKKVEKGKREIESVGAEKEREGKG